MNENVYRALFGNFIRKLRELDKKRHEAEPPESSPYEYILYVRDRNKNTVSWASNIENYHDAELIEGIIHETTLNDFRHLGLKEISKEEYIDQRRDLICEIFTAVNERSENMPDDFEITEMTY